MWARDHPDILGLSRMVKRGGSENTHVSAVVRSWGGIGPTQSLLVYTAWVRAMLDPRDPMPPPSQDQGVTFGHNENN